MNRFFSAALAAALTCALVAGCAKNSNGSQGNTALDHGRAVFTENCAQCHGADGTQGGVGPSLKDEKARKNYSAAVAWIKNPAAPMPKLYPAPLTEKDVEDVAAYVESL